MPPERLDRIPLAQETASVTADGAFDTRKCHEAMPPAVRVWTDHRRTARDCGHNKPYDNGLCYLAGGMLKSPVG